MSRESQSGCCKVKEPVNLFTKHEPTRTAGPVYDPAKDGKRLGQQHEEIKQLMLDGKWRTLAEIAEETDNPEASVSAQLRHLRKQRFGGYTVDRRRRDGGTYEYRVTE